MMTQLEKVEKEHIQPLTKAEKEQLIKDVQRMLQEEELRELGFVPGAVYEIVTPNVTMDMSDDIKGVAALEKLLKEEGHGV